MEPAFVPCHAACALGLGGRCSLAATVRTNRSEQGVELGACPYILGVFRLLGGDLRVADVGCYKALLALHLVQRDPRTLEAWQKDLKVTWSESNSNKRTRSHEPAAVQQAIVDVAGS